MAVNAQHAVGRADLVGAFEETALNENQYVADQVFPVVGVPDQSAKFPAVTRESLTSMERDPVRGTDGTYPFMHFATEDKEYACVDRGLQILLDDAQVTKLAKQYGIPVDEVAGQILYHQVRRQHEQRVAALVQSTSEFTAGKGNYTDFSGTPWSTTTTDILAQIQTAQEAVFAHTGLVPTDMVISFTLLNYLLRNEKIRGAVADNKDKTVAGLASMLAPVLGLERLHVARGVYNATPGGGDFVAAKIWSDSYANVFVNNPDATLVAPRLGATLTWTQDSPQLVVLEEYRSDAQRGDVMRARHNTDELLLDSAFGHLLKVG